MLRVESVNLDVMPPTAKLVALEQSSFDDGQRAVSILADEVEADGIKGLESKYTADQLDDVMGKLGNPEATNPGFSATIHIAEARILVTAARLAAVRARQNRRVDSPLPSSYAAAPDNLQGDKANEIKFEQIANSVDSGLLPSTLFRPASGS